MRGWDEDQCWTLARIADLVARRFRVQYTLAGMHVLLHRIGWSVQYQPGLVEGFLAGSRPDLTPSPLKIA